ncbi:MAG: hypothetical protein PHI67_04970 [Candidatus Methanomethylophilaceae archaeon]|nr:hypothetical protein [Candidatus Methanomethylophilaceae archaeon]
MAFPTLHTLNYEDLNDNFTLMADYIESVRDALAGDRQFSLSQTTATPLVSELGAGDVVYTITVSLVNGDGDVLDWYNGKVKLAIEDDDTPDATINPAAGEHDMVGGQLDVTVTMPEATWVAGKKATLTVSAPSSATNAIITGVTDATFIATVTADPE